MATVNRFLCADVAGDMLDLSLVDDRGEVLAQLERKLAGKTGSCADPQDWWRAMRAGTKDLLRRAKAPAESIRAVGLSGSLERMVCIGDDGTAHCPTVDIDPEALAACNQLIVERCGSGNLSNITGQRALGANLAAQVLWVQEHAKRVWHDLAHILYGRDFLRFRLTDCAATDPSSASRSLLFNVRQRIWSKQLASRLKIPLARLPQVLPGRQIGGRVTPVAAKETGLPAGTPVIMGGAHAAATAVALGVTAPGQALIELGGNGSCLIITAQAIRPKSAHLACGSHCLADTACLEAGGLTTEDGIDWILREVATAELQRARRAKRDPLDVLAEQAAETPPGADGLLYLQADEERQGGAFVGLRNDHGHGHLVRAVLEGGALELHGIFRELEALEVPVDTILLTGPGTRNRLWCQIVTDAIGRKTAAVTAAHLPAIGTALMAATATGCVKDLAAACAAVKLPRQRYAPRQAAVETYDRLHPQVVRLGSGIAKALAPPHT